VSAAPVSNLDQWSSLEVDTAGRRIQKSGNAVGQGRFPGAALAHERQKFPTADGQVHIFYSMHDLGFLPEAKTAKPETGDAGDRKVLDQSVHFDEAISHGFGFQQATPVPACPLGSPSSGGASIRHRSIICGHRGLKRQPGIREGTSGVAPGTTGSGLTRESTVGEQRTRAAV